MSQQFQVDKLRSSIIEGRKKKIAELESRLQDEKEYLHAYLKTVPIVHVMEKKK